MWSSNDHFRWLKLLKRQLSAFIFTKKTRHSIFSEIQWAHMGLIHAQKPKWISIALVRQLLLVTILSARHRQPMLALTKWFSLSFSVICAISKSIFAKTIFTKDFVNSTKLMKFLWWGSSFDARLLFNYLKHRVIDFLSGTIIRSVNSNAKWNNELLSV